MPSDLNDLQRYAIEEFVEHFHEGLMTRREMVQRVLAITGSVAATATVLLSLVCAPAVAPPTAVPTPVATAPPAPTPTIPPTAVPAASPASSPGARAAPTPPPARSKFSVKPDDPAITAADVTFPGEGAALLGYLAQPK